MEATQNRLGGLRRFADMLVRGLGLLALGALVGIGLLALLLARDGFDAADVILTVLLVGAPATVLFFVLGVRELAELPGRVQRLPRRGAEQLDELATLAARARAGGWTRLPFVLWQLRGAVGSTRDLMGIALPLRVFAPPFLAFTLGAAVVSAFLIGVGLIALVVLAVS